MSPTAKSLVDAEEVNVNVIGLTLVIEPLVTVVDVIVMVGGGLTKSTLVAP